MCEAAWGALREGCEEELYAPSSTTKKPVVIKDRTGKQWVLFHVNGFLSIPHLFPSPLYSFLA